MIKFCFIDTETTGTDSKKNGIIQIAGEIIFADENKTLELESKGQFNFSVKPFESDVIEDKALEVNKITREEIATFDEPKIVYNKFLPILNANCDQYNKQDKMFFVGYNARFDYDFMRSWFEKNSNQYFGSYFFFPPIDVMNIAIFNCIRERHLLENFKLATVADHLKVSCEGEFHDALKDIIVTKNIFMKYLEIGKQ